jgi:hypothetical protein
MKARDIIPGWPRGRSTVNAWPQDLDMLWFRRNLSKEAVLLLKADADLTREYHEDQQLMVDGFRANVLTRRDWQFEELCFFMALCMYDKDGKIVSPMCTLIPKHGDSDNGCKSPHHSQHQR